MTCIIFLCFLKSTSCHIKKEITVSHTEEICKQNSTDDKFFFITHDFLRISDIAHENKNK